jgi:hypothetical protein
MTRPILLLSLLAAGLFAAAPDSVFAYGGPGSVISGIGAFLAAVAALLATLFGFIWFPLKRLYESWTEEEEPAEEATASQPSE